MGVDGSRLSTLRVLTRPYSKYGPADGRGLDELRTLLAKFGAIDVQSSRRWALIAKYACVCTRVCARVWVFREEEISIFPFTMVE